MMPARALLRLRIPQSLSLEVLDGRGWVGIAPFKLSRLRHGAAYEARSGTLDHRLTERYCVMLPNARLLAHLAGSQGVLIWLPESLPTIR